MKFSRTLPDRWSHGALVSRRRQRLGVRAQWLPSDDMIAGGILVVLGVTGAGAAVEYLPRPSRIHVSN